MKKRLKTIHGETATRRVKWFQPHYDMLNGEKIVDVLVMLEVAFDDEPYRLVYAGTQFGLDMKGRAVLPGGRVVNKNPNYVVGFNFAVPLATMFESVENFVREMNGRTKFEWWTPAGMQIKGDVHPSTISTSRRLPNVNELRTV